MALFSKLKELFGGGKASGSSQGSVDPNGIMLHFRCQRCGAVVRIRVDKRNDLNREDDGPGVFLLRKDVMDNKCFQLMNAEVWLDSSNQVVSSDVAGGELISEEEYTAAITPPVQDDAVDDSAATD